VTDAEGARPGAAIGPPERARPTEERGGWGAGEPQENVRDTAHALTTLTPIRPPWDLFLRPLLRVCQYLPHDEFRLLSFIHYVQWIVIGDFPRRTRSGGLLGAVPRRLGALVGRAPKHGPGQRLHYPYILFESNFNGDFASYIEAFSRVIPERMKLIWGRGVDFPGPQPTGPFLRYIRANEYVAAHYYSAYPEATTTMVCSALELKRRAVEFDGRARGLPPSQFAAEWRRFLRAAEHWL
jgi:hypothetical protein